MPDEDDRQAAHRVLVDRILNAPGHATEQERARAFQADDLGPPLNILIGKVATGPTRITEADFAAVKAAGYSDDQVFELVVCAAVGQSARRYEAGLVALALATGGGGAG